MFKPASATTDKTGLTCFILVAGVPSYSVDSIADLSKNAADKGTEKGSFVIGTIDSALATKTTVNGYTWHANVQWGANSTDVGCWCDSTIAADAKLTKNQTYYRTDGTSFTLGIGAQNA